MDFSKFDLSRIFPGYKTYAAAVGLAVTAYYYYAAKDYVSALGFLSQALAAFGLRSALASTLAVPTVPTVPTVPQPPAPTITP